MSESTQEWILKRRHEDLGVTVRMCWDLYIKFYTVFLTFSVVGLGWILTQRVAGLKEGRNPERKAFLTLVPDSDHHENTIYETRTNFVKSGAA